MTSAIEIHAAKRALREQMGWHWGGRHTRMWHGLPSGILGIGFGVKRTKGNAVAKECIRIYVRNKRSKSDLRRKQMIPKTVNGYPTDVVVASRIRPHLGPGGSIGNSQGESGSLACVVQDSDREYLLGSWHVFTNVYGKDGDPVYMPSIAQDANALITGNLIGTPTFHLNGGANAFDASVAVIADGVAVDTTLQSGQGFGPCSAPETTASVLMQGAESGQMEGTVDGISEDIVVAYGDGVSGQAVLTGQIAIVGDDGDFSTAGDSGALVCTSNFSPIGVLVGGSMSTQGAALKHSFASPIQPILDFYQVTIKS